MKPPKVFISHASEDKDRFVLDFAKKLCEHGIDPWVDKWEILPGDSIVDKIFEEGIGQAQAIIVILSKYSVNKRWVQEELNAGLVKRIQKGSRLIPIVLDIEEEQIPQALKSIIWVKIQDLQHYEEQLRLIVNAINERKEKPPIKISQKIESEIKGFPSLKPPVSTVFELACEEALTERHTTQYRHIVVLPKPFLKESILDKAMSKGIKSRKFFDCLNNLEEYAYIIAYAEDLESKYRKILSFTIKLLALENYLRNNLIDYNSIKKKIGIEIVKKDRNDTRNLAETLNLSHPLIYHLFELWDEENYIRYSKPLSHVVNIYLSIEYIYPSFKEWLKTI